jgi:hypothetical protein
MCTFGLSFIFIQLHNLGYKIVNSLLFITLEFILYLLLYDKNQLNA